MPLRPRPTPNVTKVLVITAAWTLTLVLSYTSSYLLIGDLIGLGKLSGTMAFWPDFIGNAVIGIVGGVVGGSILVYRVNAAYKHATFLSSIVHSGMMFLLVFAASQVLLLFTMAFVLDTARGGLLTGLRSGVRNLGVNLLTPTFVANTLFIGLIVAGTQFMLQVNDKFGPGVLWKLLTGKYYHPRDEERIFMFLDLRSSTEIAERIGHKRFFELLRELFQDVTRPVVDSKGDIYQYVGDEIVITWPVHRGMQDGNCIECFFRIERAITSRSAWYTQHFGVVPQFKAGVHVGEATVGEIGVIKKDIVFSGDVLNTTARIQEECNRHRVDLLASDELLRRMSVGRSYAATLIGEIQLRGKAEALSLSAVHRAAAVAA
jgi:adenylate cyclase